MTMSSFDAKRLEEIRASLDHPVIDADGHMVEYMPAVREHLLAVGGESVASQFDPVFDSASLVAGLDESARRALGLYKLSWWAFPTRNTQDRAVGFLPGLFAEKAPEIGLDFAVLYPTLGLSAPMADDAELRGAACRAFNIYYAEVCADDAERVRPAAVIPMHTPEEALEELDFAVSELGFKVAVLPGFVARPIPGAENIRGARWLDSYGPDEPAAYDRVWARCAELGIAPTFHSSGMGWGSRTSQTSYVHNHIGNFAAGGEAICRSLMLSGVPHRFPELTFAFLEGGVGWGTNLCWDLISHLEKRGGRAIEQFSPAELDRAEIEKLFTRYGSESVQRNLDQLDRALHILSDPDQDKTTLDEFRHSGMKAAEDIGRVFGEQFFFGCEADDPMTTLAFDPRMKPPGGRVRPLFSSDIAHWDVPDMRCVLLEAWEMVETERLEVEEFRDFVFQNAVDLYCGPNPDFFKGTAVESAVLSAMGRLA
ncbi:MAG: amidohydrolase family protein [Myxococcota bacterium]|nr:amidohydrolase family protein [Myxococcota bacterium]